MGIRSGIGSWSGGRRWGGFGGIPFDTTCAKTDRATGYGSARFELGLGLELILAGGQIKRFGEGEGSKCMLGAAVD